MTSIRVDTWWSALTKLGTAFDKLTSFRFAKAKILTPEECSNLYYFNALAAKVCDAFPEDAMREGVCAKDDRGEEVEAIQTRLTDLNAVRLLSQAGSWGGAFGAAGVYLSVVDGQSLDKPLDPTRVTTVEFLRVVDRRDLAIQQRYQDPMSTKFQLPELLTFVQSGTSNVPVIGKHIHESRFLWFEGIPTGQREANTDNQGWPYSKLQRVHEELLRVGVSWAAAAQMLQTVSQTVIKIKGLQNALVSEQGAESLEKRAMMVDTARSITRSLWIDADGEDVIQLQTSLAGIADLLDRLGSSLSAATGIPVTKLFGTMPTGLGATGAADERSWNNRVESYREQIMKPQIDKLVACLAAEQSVSGEITISFPSLDRPTPIETADLRLKVAQADAIYISNQVLLPEEIATSRFGGVEWSAETQLKEGPREELDVPAPPESEKPEDEDASNDEDVVSEEVPRTDGDERFDKFNPSEGTDPKARSDGFDPSQPRDEDGKWSGSGGANSKIVESSDANDVPIYTYDVGNNTAHARDVHGDVPEGANIFYRGSNDENEIVRDGAYFTDRAEHAAPYVHQNRKGVLIAVEVPHDLRVARAKDLAAAIEATGSVVDSERLWEHTENKAVRAELKAQGFEALDFEDEGPDNGYQHNTRLLLSTTRVRELSRHRVSTADEDADE